MARTPLGTAIARLARDVALASALGVEVGRIRAARREAAARRPVRAAGPASSPAPGNRLSRRALLAGAGAVVAGTAAGGLLPAPARAQPGRGLRVAIVGGGLAGLAAALTLADARVRSTVYEASLSVGGRIHSNTTYWDDAQVTEWCGEFVNSDHATVLGLARRFRIETIDLPLQSPVGADETFLLDGQRYPEADALRDFRPVHAALTRDARAAGPRTTAASHTSRGVALDNQSVHTWIAANVPGGHRSPLGRLLNVAYAAEFGAPTTEQSALNLVYLMTDQPRADRLALFGASDERYRFRGGNAALPAALARQLPGGTIRLGWRLVALARLSDGGIELTFDTPDGLAVGRADHAIVTVPFAVLADVNLDRAGFDARKRQAIRDLGRGRNFKLHLQFRGRFWVEPGPEGGTARSGGAFTDGGGGATWDTSRGQPGPSGLLVNFGVLPPGEEAGLPYGDALTDPAVAERARL